MKINNKFKDLLMPLSDEEKAGLEASVLKNGVIDTLIVWANQNTWK